MAEVEATHERCHRRRALAILLLAAAILAAPGLLRTAEAAAAGCEADYCTTVITDPDGRATLTIPGKLVRLAYPQLKECTWEVEARYGDGSPPGSYVFSETTGLEAEHTYPKPGTYTFNAYATNGMHDGTSESCPDVHIEATVIYPDSTPPEEEQEPGPGGPGVQVPGTGAGVAANPLPAGTPPMSRATAYWQACGHGVRAHLVPCRRAKRVVRAARGLIPRAKLELGATFKAAGFSCRLRADGDVACRYGKQLVLGT